MNEIARACLLTATLLLLPDDALSLELAPVGRPVTVFASTDDRCAANDIPDAPARAFRGQDGTVHLMAAHDHNRFLVGPSLLEVRPDCRIVHAGSGDPDPAARDDRTWLAAFHTEDGLEIVALGHMEYQGHRHPGRCLAKDYRSCWRNAVVELMSADGGRSFRTTSPDGRGQSVADLAEDYDGRAGRPTGYFGPSNIIAHDGYLWAFMFAEASGAQRRGVCLLRAAPGKPPLQWRTYDGTGFAARLDGSGNDGAATVCTPLKGLGSTLATVVRHEPTGLFIGVEAARRQGPDGVEATGIWWRSSPDLLHWSAPTLLLATPLLFAHACEERTMAYPSLLDPTSSSPTFATTGDRPWLHLVELSMRGCKPTMQRDLVRIPLEIRP